MKNKRNLWVYTADKPPKMKETRGEYKPKTNRYTLNNELKNASTEILKCQIKT